MESSLKQVTTFDTIHAGSYDSDDYDIRKVPISENEKPQLKRSGPTTNATRVTPKAQPRLSLSKICHQKSSIGVVLGSIWVRTSTLKSGREVQYHDGSARSHYLFHFLSGVVALAHWPSLWYGGKLAVVAHGGLEVQRLHGEGCSRELTHLRFLSGGKHSRCNEAV